jgi:putative tricarboxylic transport membrane protein
MIIAAPLLARLAYKFGSPEYFALALFGLSMLASISSGSSVKNLIGGAFGILISTVGLDFTTGASRFTFGFPELTEGLNFIPVMIGLFGGAELLKQSTTLHIQYKIISQIAIRLPSFLDFKKLWKTIFRSSAIGTFIGILPAEGATVAAMIGYNEAKRWSKNQEEFGKGAIEGIAGPESANNAATGGAMVPTLALGIPGSGATAVILGAMLMHGLRPGPALFSQQPMLLYSIFFSMLLSNILFLTFGLIGTKLFARVTLIPRTFLWPSVFILASVGSYALQQSMLDVWVMLSFSFFGFILKRFGFSAAPIVIGLILGELVETSLKQSLVIFEGDWALFLNRPLVVVFFILTFMGLFWQTIRKGLTWIKKIVNINPR